MPKSYIRVTLGACLKTFLGQMIPLFTVDSIGFYIILYHFPCMSISHHLWHTYAMRGFYFPCSWQVWQLFYVKKNYLIFFYGDNQDCKWAEPSWALVCSGPARLIFSKLESSLWHGDMKLELGSFRICRVGDWCELDSFGMINEMGSTSARWS